MAGAIDEMSQHRRGIMSDEADVVRATPTRGRLGSRLGCVSAALASLVLALLVAISAVLLIPVSSCACATPLDLVVQNYSHHDASVSWSQPGLFGTPLRGLSGGAVASGCRTLSAGLRSGVVEVSVSMGGVSRTFHLHVRDTQADLPWAIVIGADEHIADPISGDPPGGLRQQDALC
jgi:hypothetical protein